MKFIILTFLVTLSFSSSINSMETIYLEGFASSGYGSAVEDDESESPTMLIYDVGATAGYRILPMFWLGATASYQFINQLSETDEDYGNRKGTRSPVLSPSLGFSFLSYAFKYQYLMSGTYTLSKETADEEELIYTEPKGHRITFYFRLLELNMGLFYETTTFDEIDEGGDDSSPDNKMTLSHFGAQISTLF